MDAGNDLIRQLLAALFVLALLAALVWTLRGKGVLTRSTQKITAGGIMRKWLNVPAHSGTIEVVERKALTPQHTLHRLRASGRDFLIATYPHGCQLIAELDAEEPARETSTSGPASAFPAGGGL